MCGRDLAMRRAELAAGLATAQERIATACAAAGRSPEEITLITVTKTWPAADIAHLIALGMREFGESKEQEGHLKHSDLAELLSVTQPPVRWHFIGQLQRNKAAKVGQWADVVHSLDRPELLEPLVRSGRRIEGLIQVRLEEDPAQGRGGIGPSQVEALADAVVSAGVLLRGVMGVAPLGRPAGPAFARLREARDRLLRQHPEARWISAGMSGDLEEAIAEGATHVRLGTSILGSRY